MDASFIQGIEQHGAGGATSWTWPSLTPTAGNAIIVYVYNYSSDTCTSVTDTQSNTYTQVGSTQTFDGGTGVVQCFVAYNVAGAATVVTANMDGITQYAGGTVSEYSNLGAYNTESTLTVTADGTSHSANAITISAVGELITSFYGNYGGGTANQNATSGNLRHSGIFPLIDQITATSSGTFTPTLTTSVTSSWSTTQRSFSPAGGSEQALTPGLFTNSNTFFGGTVSQNIVPDLFTNSNSFYTSSVGNTLQADLYANSNTFFGGSVAIEQTISQSSRFDNTNQFFAGSVSVSLQVGLYTNTNQFYSPTVSLNIQPGLFTNQNQFFAAVVVQDQILTANRYDDPDVFFGATIIGSQPLSPTRLDNVNQFFGGSIRRAGDGFFVFQDNTWRYFNRNAKYWNGSNWIEISRKPTLY